MQFDLPVGSLVQQQMRLSDVNTPSLYVFQDKPQRISGGLEVVDRLNGKSTAVLESAMGAENVGSSETETNASTPKDPSKSEAQLNVLVIGFGMTAWRLLTTLNQLGVEGRLSLTVIGEERQPAYDRVRLTDLLGHRSLQQLMMSRREWYRERSIEIVLGERVVEVDRDEGVVWTSSGRRFPYDRLVFATGSEPRVPTLAQVQSPRVLVYRRPSDLKRIRELSSEASRVAVLGGGLLGVEVADAVKNLGPTVTILERSEGLLSRQLDLVAAERLKEQLQERGIEVRTTTSLQSIDAEESLIRLGLLTSGAEEVLTSEEFDFLILAIGIVPRDDLASKIGLAVDENGGILIDDKLQTSAENIYAIGECVSLGGERFGVVHPCYEMADVLAKRLMGQDCGFVPEVLSTYLKLSDASVASAGVGFQRDASGVYTAYRFDKDDLRTIYVDQNGRLVGASMVGNWPEFSAVAEAIKQQAQVDAKQLRNFVRWGTTIFADKLGVLNWSDNHIVCACYNTSKGQIVAASKAGMGTVQFIGASTRAGTGCGSCKPIIANLLGAEPEHIKVPGQSWVSLSSVLVLITLGLYLVQRNYSRFSRL